jgi:hypothetical protein
MDVAAFGVSCLGKHGGPYCLGLAGMRRLSLTQGWVGCVDFPLLHGVLDSVSPLRFMSACGP